MPRTCVERRLGPPITATISPAAKPAMRMLVPPFCAIHASTNSTSSDKRRSSAQRRCLERWRSRCTHSWPFSSLARTNSATAAPATYEPPNTTWPTRPGCSTIGTARIVTMSAIVTCAITLSTSRAGKAGLLDRRQQHGGGAGGEHDRVDRSVAGAGDVRAKQSRWYRQQTHEPRQQAALARRRSEPPFAQWQLHTDRQHQHREADFAERRNSDVGRIDAAQHGRADEDPGDDLAYDHRDEAAGDGSKQRAAEARKHDQHERPEAHRLRTRSKSSSVMVSQVITSRPRSLHRRSTPSMTRSASSAQRERGLRRGSGGCGGNSLRSAGVISRMVSEPSFTCRLTSSNFTRRFSAARSA